MTSDEDSWIDESESGNGSSAEDNPPKIAPEEAKSQETPTSEAPNACELNMEIVSEVTAPKKRHHESLSDSDESDIKKRSADAITPTKTGFASPEKSYAAVAGAAPQVPSKKNAPETRPMQTAAGSKKKEPLVFHCKLSKTDLEVTKDVITFKLPFIHNLTIEEVITGLRDAKVMRENNVKTFYMNPRNKIATIQFLDHKDYENALGKEIYVRGKTCSLTPIVRKEYVPTYVVSLMGVPLQVKDEVFLEMFRNFGSKVKINKHSAKGTDLNGVAYTFNSNIRILTFQHPRDMQSIPDQIVLYLDDNREVTIQTRHDGNAGQRKAFRRPQTCRYCGGDHSIQECEDRVAEELLNKEEFGGPKKQVPVPREEQQPEPQVTSQEKYDEQDLQDEQEDDNVLKERVAEIQELEKEEGHGNSIPWAPEDKKFVAHGAASARNWTKRHFIRRVTTELGVDDVHAEIARALTRRKLNSLPRNEKVSEEHIDMYFPHYTLLTEILYRLGATALTTKDPGSPRASNR